MEDDELSEVSFSSPAACVDPFLSRTFRLLERMFLDSLNTWQARNRTFKRGLSWLTLFIMRIDFLASLSMKRALRTYRRHALIIIGDVF